MCQLQQSSMAGGGGSVISVEAFNFLEVSVFGLHIFLDTTFQRFSGSCSSCSCLSVGLPEGSAVRGRIRLPCAKMFPTGSSRSAL